jgi:UrcA family protein
MNAYGSILRLPALCLAIAGLACLAGNAEAQNAGAGHQLTVRYSDLNLATPQGATLLYARIRGAARFVCGEEGVSLNEKRQWEQCERAAISQAISAVHSPILTTLDSGNGASAMPTVLRDR